MKTNRRTKVGAAALTAMMCVPGQAFWMPLPVHDNIATGHAAELLESAQKMLDIASSMQNTLENIEASVDAGIMGFLSKVPLPGGWIGEEGRQAILTGKVPYTALSSGIFDNIDLSPDMRKMVGTGLEGLRKGSSPIDVAIALGTEQVVYEKLDPKAQTKVDKWMKSAGPKANPDQHFSAVMRLTQNHAAGEVDKAIESDGWQPPQWAQKAIDSTQGGGKAWIQEATNAPPWMVNLGMKHAGAVVRTTIGTTVNSVNPAIMERIGQENGNIFETMAQKSDSIPPGTETMLASVRTAAAALANHEGEKAGMVKIGENARAHMKTAHPSAPMSVRAQHNPNDVEAIVWENARTGGFDGHIEMQTTHEINASAEEERGRANIERTMMAGNAEKGMISKSRRENTAQEVRRVIKEMRAYQTRYNGKREVQKALVDKLNEWTRLSMSKVDENIGEWRQLSHEGAKRTARTIAERGLAGLNENAAREVQNTLPAGAAARARRACGQLNKLGVGSTICQWIEGQSTPGRNTTTGSEANARRWDRIGGSLMGAEREIEGRQRKGVSEALEKQIKTNARNRQARTSEEGAQAQSGCFVQPKTRYEPWPGKKTARECPGEQIVAGSIVCPIGTPEHGEKKWKVAPTDALYVAGPVHGEEGVRPREVYKIREARKHYVRMSVIEAITTAMAVQTETQRRRRQAGEMIDRLGSCEDLLCELRVSADIARLQAEEAAQGTYLELSKLDLRIAESIDESELWRH